MLGCDINQKERMFIPITSDSSSISATSIESSIRLTCHVGVEPFARTVIICVCTCVTKQLLSMLLLYCIFLTARSFPQESKNVSISSHLSGS